MQKQSLLISPLAMTIKALPPALRGGGGGAAGPFPVIERNEIVSTASYLKPWWPLKQQKLESSSPYRR